MPRVRIQMTGHRSDGFTEETVEETYPALLTEDGEKTILHYVMNSGNERIRCEMTMMPSRLTIQNRGAVESCLKLEPGLIGISRYRTPYGSFPIETETEKLEVVKTGHGVFAEVAYSLLSDRTLINKSCLRITVTPEEEASSV